MTAGWGLLANLNPPQRAATRRQRHLVKPYLADYPMPTTNWPIHRAIEEQTQWKLATSFLYLFGFSGGFAKPIAS
jgi:hypothetical protein